MAESDECMKHALLAFAGGYALDLNPSEYLRNRTNYHYREASKLLTEKLRNPRNLAFGEEDALVGALRVFWSDYVSVLEVGYLREY
jgi:hypothetical protein